MSNEASSNIRNTNGDLTTEGAMNGLSFTANVSANTTLWAIASKYDRYILTPTGADRTITLPAVGNTAYEAGTGAQHGHDIFIKNNSASNNLIINDVGGATVLTLPPTQTVHLSADINATDDWYILGTVAESYPGPSVETLQAAYNASGTTNPQIQLSVANGGFKIRDNATQTAEPLSVKDSAGTKSLIVLKNVVSGTDTPAFELMGGSATASGAKALGNGSVASGAGSSVDTDGSSAITNSVANSKLELYSGGFTRTSGPIQLGTANSDPFTHTLYFKLANVATVSGSANVTALLTMNDKTSYNIRIRAIGRDVVSTTEATFTTEISYIVRTGTATYFINRTQEKRTRRPGPGAFGRLTLTNTGATLNMNTYGSQNVSTGALGAMNFVITARIEAYTIA